MVVLAFGGRHRDAIENLMTMVPKRLNKNPKLRAELAAAFEQSGGTTMPIDHVPLERLFALIARGLLWHHWQTVLGPGYSAIASMFADARKTFFAQMLNKWNTPNCVTGNLGEGTFCYEGAQVTDCVQMSIWRLSMYGDIVFGGDPNVPGPSSLAVAVTSPGTLIQKLLSTASTAILRHRNE